LLCLPVEVRRKRLCPVSLDQDEEREWTMDMDMDMESGERAAAADPRRLLDWRKKQRVTGAAQKFSVWLTGCVSGTVADLQNFPGSIGGSGPNGNVLRRYSCSCKVQNSLYAFLQEDTKHPSLSLISLLAEPIDSRFPALLVLVSCSSCRARPAP